MILVAAGSQINIYFAYYPTVGALTGSEAEVSALTGAAQRPSQAVTTPVVERWTGPATGTSQVVTATIPGTVSGFTARDAYIYLPPAYTSPSPPLLPVLILVSGQPGGPQDWITAGNLQAQLDQFAAANNGLAPVAVVVDPNGPQGHHHDVHGLEHRQGRHLPLAGRAELDHRRARRRREPRALGVRRVLLRRDLRDRDGHPAHEPLPVVHRHLR